MVENMGESSDSQGHKYNFSGVGTNEDGGSFKEQDRLLPIANVGRIMKQKLPTNAKISKEAKETMQECVSEFISFVTSEASEKCQREKRKTVNGDDVCWALATLGFDDYTEPLKRYLHKYREVEGEKANQSKANNTDNRGESSDFGGDELRNQTQGLNVLNFNGIQRDYGSNPNPF